MILTTEAQILLNTANFRQLAITNNKANGNNLTAAVGSENVGWSGSALERDQNSADLAEWLDAQTSSNLDAINDDLSGVQVTGKHPCD
jgi:hypothetical protein